MAQPRPREAARLRARRRRAHARAARIVALAFLAATLLLVLLLTAFGSDQSPVAIETQPARASRLLPTGPPQPQTIATLGTLQLQLPVAQSALTAIGFHGSGDGAVQLSPVGRQGNAGLAARIWYALAGAPSGRTVWYQLEGSAGPGTSALDVGAAPGTDVYSPVDGAVVGITDFVVDGRAYGARVDIRPQGAPSVVVSLTQLRPDPSLTVGSTVAASTSKVGTVIDLSSAERQALARYTQDAGTNVSIEVRPAATFAS